MQLFFFFFYLRAVEEEEEEKEKKQLGPDHSVSVFIFRQPTSVLAITKLFVPAERIETKEKHALAMVTPSRDVRPTATSHCWAYGRRQSFPRGERDGTSVVRCRACDDKQHSCNFHPRFEFVLSLHGAIEREPPNEKSLRRFRASNRAISSDMSSARAFVLRKQQSCVGDFASSDKTNRRYQLQKQFSIDQSRKTIAGPEHDSDLVNGNWRAKDTSAEKSLRVITAINYKINNGNQCEGYVRPLSVEGTSCESAISTSLLFLFCIMFSSMNV